METAGTTYGVREVADLLGVPIARVRSLARAGLVQARRGDGGELRFGFRELAFMRQMRDLPEGRVSPRRVRRALSRLRAALPPERDLCEFGLATASGELVVRETGRLWSPESGQFVFDFEGPARDAARPPRRVVALASARGAPTPDAHDAEGWYRLGCDLETADGERARAAYRRALALDPDHADAHVNLGCLEHEAGRLEEAELHYRAALARRSDGTARFDLAVVLEDQKRDAEARETYLACLAEDPECAEAHFNLARLAERTGDEEAVVRHLVAYRRLARETR